MATNPISLPARPGAPVEPAGDPHVVTVMAFEQWLSEYPHVRCYVPLADAKKLRPGVRVAITLTLGRLAALEGTFVVDIVRTDNFAIVCPVDDARELFGLEGIGEFDPDAPLVSRQPPGVPITEYRQIWVYKPGVVLADGKTGFVFALKADAQQMIDDGDAVDAYDPRGLPEIGSAGQRPLPPEPEPVTEQALPVEVYIAFMSEGMNPICESIDTPKLRNNDLIKLQQKTGARTFPEINGRTGIVLRSSSQSAFQLFGVPTRGLQVDGLTCVGEVVTERRATITSLTAADPAVATSRDAGLLFEGDELTLEQLTGAPIDALRLTSAVVRFAGLAPGQFELEGVDLTGEDLTDVTVLAVAGRPDIINFILFSDDAATVATVPGVQGLGFTVGDEMTVYQYAGEPVDALDAKPATITAIHTRGYEVTLDIDLSGVDIDGVRAYGLITRRPTGRP